METSSRNGMTEQLINTWTDIGSQMWKNWFDLVGMASQAPLQEQQAGLEAVSQRFFDQQQLLARLLRLSFHTWQESFPQVRTGENWQQFLQNYSQSIRSQLDEFSTGMLKANQDVGGLWQLYLQEIQKFNQLWGTSLLNSLHPLGQAVSTAKAEPLLELNSLYWNLLYEETSAGLLRSPLLGPTRELNGKVLRAFDAWTQLYRASVDYQIVLAEVQGHSFEALMRELVTKAEQGKTIKDWREFQQLWAGVADTVFEQAFCQEANLKVRGRFLNALNVYRLHQQELLEVWMGMMNLPLRSEVDELHKTVYELRKEVKRLKKQLAQLETQTATQPRTSELTNPPPATAPATPSKGTSSPKGSKSSRARGNTSAPEEQPPETPPQDATPEA
uniref:Poly(3-hydroxyalkanoate) polymerase subunit PhaE n=1 Tax=Cyanothece sp. (strain PCC 7425 / ATCC 29141) TaxID=395961 RepID=B8HVQ8_CYAP4